MRAPINRATSESFPQRFSSQHRQAHPIIVAQIVSHRNIAQSASVRHRSLKKCHLRVSSRNCVYTPSKQTNGGNGCVWIVVLRIDPCMWSVEPRETKKVHAHAIQGHVNVWIDVIGLFNRSWKVERRGTCSSETVNGLQLERSDLFIVHIFFSFFSL